MIILNENIIVYKNLDDKLGIYGEISPNKK